MRCLEYKEYLADIRCYERIIEAQQKELDHLKHEQDLRNYEKAIEEQKKEHEQELAQAREQYEAQIRQLRSEIASLKQPWSQRAGIPLSVVFPAFLLPLFPLLRRTPADYFLSDSLSYKYAKFILPPPQ